MSGKKGKKEEAVLGRDKTLKTVSDQVGHAKYGPDGNPSRISYWISSGSPLLDAIVSGKAEGGGFPAGRITEIFGLPSLGKSTLGMHTMISAQKEGVSILLDSESGWSGERAERAGHNDRYHLYETASSVEDGFKNLLDTMGNVRSRLPDIPVVVVWDALSAVASSKEMFKASVADVPRITREGMRFLTEAARECRAVVLIVNHAITKIGSPGTPITSGTGDAEGGDNPSC